VRGGSRLGQIDADFVPAKRETQYYVSQSAGSGTAVDLGCTNAGVGTHEPQKTTVEKGHTTTSFVWYHPDPDASVPPGKYHCDHADMGPHGHQGLITVVVADKDWSCTATYKGTLSSTAASLTNGTASEPKCSKVG
jgi:hypothetical protein